MCSSKTPAYQRIFLIVCDSLGFGALDDAALYGDEKADTFGHVCQAAEHIVIPNLERLGAWHIHPASVASCGKHANGVSCLLKEASVGKDTLTGHWEMMGIVTEHPFLTFPNGFPAELVRALEKETARKVVGNKKASGTEILAELSGLVTADSNKMIVYTSADSVLQICGDEGTAGGLDELYRCCEIARKLTLSHPEWRVARVIARPYIVNADGSCIRTANRKDYSVLLPHATVLDALSQAGYDVMAVGKIQDIFSGQGITEHVHSESSAEGMKQVISYAEQCGWSGLCFANLSDFDVLWGHRRNPQGYAGELERFDIALGELMGKLGNDDLVIITADHGNDPTAPGTDHTREYVPMLSWSPKMGDRSAILPPRNGFGDIGATVAHNFGVALPQGCAGLAIEEIFAFAAASRSGC